MAAQEGVAILGVFVADLAFRAGRQPKIGETIVGSGFKMGPGGKGSNQSVAAARVGAKVTFISKIGRDAFGEIALKTWKEEGIVARAAQSDKEPTGAAYIFVNHDTGENAIIVYPGAGGAISAGRRGRGRRCDPRRQGVRDAARAAGRRRPARAGDRARRRRRHDLQSRAGRADPGFDLSALRLHRAERDRGRDPDRPAGRDARRCHSASAMPCWPRA